MFKIETIRCKNPFKAAKELIKAQGKYRQIGSGAYGKVYGMKGSNIVYKMGEVGENDGYLSWMRELSKQKKQNPYTPVVYGVRIYEGECEDDYGYKEAYFVVAMERLTSGRGIYEAAEWFEATLSDYSTDQRVAHRVLGIKIPKALDDVLKMMWRARESADYADWDLHDGNFMYRGKQVVVTDPLC